MSDIYSPFSSLINSVWTLSEQEYHRFVNQWKDPSSSLAASLAWFHPIHPCFRTCFTLVVLHTNQVMGDGATELLYSSIFQSASLRQMGHPRVYAFKQSMALFSQKMTPQAYRVQTSTDFVPLQFHQESTGSETWPVSSTDERGRVIFFVSLSDLPSIEQEFARRRKSVQNEDEFMFVHRCIHVKVGGSANERTITTMNNHASPCKYFTPLVTHFLVMRSWNDLSPFPDTLSGSEAWIQREKKELEKLELQQVSAAVVVESSNLDHAVIIDQETLNVLMQDDEDHDHVQQVAVSDHVVQETSEINHVELRELLDDILPDDEEDHQQLHVGIDVMDSSLATGGSNLQNDAHDDSFNISVSEIEIDAIQGSQPTSDTDKHSEIDDHWNLSSIHPVGHSGFYNLDFMDECDDDEEDEHLKRKDERSPKEVNDDSAKKTSGVVTPTLIALTALTLSREHRRDLAGEKYVALTTHDESVMPDWKVFQNRTNLESLLRSFFMLQTKFARNLDSLDVFDDLKLISQIVQLTPFVTITYYESDSEFYEKWNFALYLASRSFFHVLHSSGFKEDRYLSCDPESVAGQQLMLDLSTSYSQFCCDSDKSWECLLCRAKVSQENQAQVDHVLPHVDSIVHRQREMSEDIRQEQTSIPASCCCVCRVSLQDYIPSFDSCLDDDCSQEGKNGIVREDIDNPEDAELSNINDMRMKREMSFCLRTFPYYNTLAFAQLACKCLKRDYCLACLAEVHLTANVKSDLTTPYEESECWCLCLTSSPDAMNHFNVLTRGKYAASSVLTNMQLRLTYVCFRQMITSSYVVSKKFRNVLVWMYNPESDHETYLTELLQGDRHVCSVNDDLAIDIDRIQHRVQEVEYRLCLTSKDVEEGLQTDSDDLLSSERGTRLRVLCCRMLFHEPLSSPHYVAWACASVADSLVQRPILGITCTDNVMRFSSSSFEEMCTSISTVRASSFMSLFMRCTLTGKMIYNMQTL